MAGIEAGRLRHNRCLNKHQQQLANSPSRPLPAAPHCPQVSQIVIWVAESRSRRMDPRFPVGQTRLETIGVLACALIMALASVQVVQESAVCLYEGFAEQRPPEIDAGLIMYLVLGGATALKLLCYVLCIALASKSDSMVALAEDHLNDIMSNVGAAVTAAVAVQVRGTGVGGGVMLVQS